MNAITRPFELLSKLDGKAEAHEPTLEEVIAAEKVFEATNCLQPTDERFAAMNMLKAALDRIDSPRYVSYVNDGQHPAAAVMAGYYVQYPALHAYNYAFERVLAGVQSETPQPGQVFIWYVYNMGYVVKTSDKCFAIDLHHRRGEELLKYLDFCCITHNHDDHYTLRFAQAMNRAHKPVITNFMANDGYPATDAEAGYSKEPTRTLTFGDIRVTTYESDHNPKLRKFVQPVEIAITTGGKTCVILSSGDTCNAQQLHPQAPVDFWIVHPYVSLKVDEGAALLKPKMTLICHLEELHHAIDNARWTYRQGYAAAQKVWDQGLDAVVPVWGDKIVWDGTIH